MRKSYLFGALAVAAVAIAAISCTEQKQEPQGLVIEKQGMFSSGGRVPIEQARQLTGIKVLDSVVDRLIKGPGPKKNPRYRGYTDPKLSATVHKLTGLTLPELRLHWHMQVARDLLRYTELPLTEVMQRCGYTSLPTFSRTVRRWWGVSPQHLRILARKSGDIGKYAL